MEKLKRLIEHYGNNTHLEVTEKPEHYAIAIEELWRKEYSQSGAGAVNKAQLLSTVLSSMRELDHLNETCRKDCLMRPDSACLRIKNTSLNVLNQL